MKPKEALVKDGFLPPGSENVRGRLSVAAIDRLKELAGSGWSIDGYSVSTSENSETVVEKVKIDPNAVVDIPDPTRDEEFTDAFTSEGSIGMRTVCNACGASLTYCPCPSPRVWLDHERQGVVYFKPRSKPRKKGW